MKMFLSVLTLVTLAQVSFAKNNIEDLTKATTAEMIVRAVYNQDLLKYSHNTSFRPNLKIALDGSGNAAAPVSINAVSCTTDSVVTYCTVQMSVVEDDKKASYDLNVKIWQGFTYHATVVNSAR